MGALISKIERLTDENKEYKKMLKHDKLKLAKAEIKIILLKKEIDKVKMYTG